MEWLNYVIWTQFAKSVAYFTVSLICVAISAYMAGYAKGRRDGFEEGLETAQELDEWLNAVAEGIEEVKNDIKLLQGMIKSLSLPPYRQP